MNIYQEFSVDDSILNKLLCINKSKWVSILNQNSTVDQCKIAFGESESEFGVSNIKSPYDYFQVIKSFHAMILRIQRILYLI